MTACGAVTSASTFSYSCSVSGPLGSYTYGDAAHADAATAIGSSYTASYDEVGNETCRAAPGSGQTCAGSSPTGALLAYDNEGRLYGWQNAPTNPTASTAYLYDSAGQRVQRVVTSGGSTTTTMRRLSRMWGARLKVASERVGARRCGTIRQRRPAQRKSRLGRHAAIRTGFHERIEAPPC